jgi:stage IV sporulation protein FB
MQGELNFVLFGVPIRVHPWFWLVAFFLGANSQDLPSILIWIIAMFICILWHEMGHAMMARAFGFYPAIILYGMGGLTSYNTAYNSRGIRLTSLRNILISLAGPFSGFLLAAIIVLIIVLTKRGEEFFIFVGGRQLVIVYGDVLYIFIGGRHIFEIVYKNIDHARLTDFVDNLFFICVFWGLVNLLPVFPLDGGQVARQLLTAVMPRSGLYWSLVLSGAAAAAMALASFIVWGSVYMAILFGYMAYMSFRPLWPSGGNNPP